MDTEVQYNITSLDKCNDFDMVQIEVLRTMYSIFEWEVLNNANLVYTKVGLR